MSDRIDRADLQKDHRSEKYRERMKGAGRRVKFAREEAGLSIRQLAEKSGIDKGQISRFEAGENLEISAGRFFDLCEALTLDPVYVWTGVMRHVRSRSTPPPPPLSEPAPLSSPLRPKRKKA